ncbi:MAG: hypothetical protein HY335_08310 [Deinococcus sp.]|nr:hypothetical protein [Deinococcus sp.]
MRRLLVVASEVELVRVLLRAVDVLTELRLLVVVGACLVLMRWMVVWAPPSGSRSSIAASAIIALRMNLFILASSRHASAW